MMLHCQAHGRAADNRRFESRNCSSPARQPPKPYLIAGLGRGLFRCFSPPFRRFRALGCGGGGGDIVATGIFTVCDAAQSRRSTFSRLRPLLCGGTSDSFTN